MRIKFFYCYYYKVIKIITFINNLNIQYNKIEEIKMRIKGLEDTVVGVTVVGGIVGAGAYGFTKAQGIEIHPDMLRYTAQFGGIVFLALAGCYEALHPTGLSQDQVPTSREEWETLIKTKTSIGAVIGASLSAVAFGVGYVAGKAF